MKNVSLILIMLAALPLTGMSQTISFTHTPQNYIAGSIDLGQGFAGAITVDPDNPDIIYASVGYWQHMSVVRINLSDESVETAASGYFGSIGGMAAPGPNQLIILDNDDNTTSSIPGETILLCTDKNTDGDFDDPGEIEELIQPILTSGGDFTGAQAMIVPDGDPYGIPSGSMIFQTADGSGNSEVCIVTEPTSSTTAQFFPAGVAFFSGFDYNGGLAFDWQGRLYCGAANDSWTGEVYALVNLDYDNKIDPGEYNDVVTSETLFGGISDITMADRSSLLVATNPWTGMQIKNCEIEYQETMNGVNILEDDVPLTDFADTDSPWITNILINSKDYWFFPIQPTTGDGDPFATLIIGGYASGWAPATNLLTLQETVDSSVEEWGLYR